MAASEAEYLRDVPASKRPKHVAIIMDGNGRWAQQRGLERIEGHVRGVETVRKVMDACNEFGIETLTLYCFSNENWKRPADELDFLMSLLENYLIAERDGLVENNIRVRIIGRRDPLPERVQAEMKKTLDACSSNTGMKLCLAINYGGRQEILDAVREVATKVQQGELVPEQIDEQCIAEHLSTRGIPDPDLLIRTSGEMRVSNFLLWQISYAEIWVTDVLWPEFDKVTLAEAVKAYAIRSRRYGGLES